MNEQGSIAFAPVSPVARRDDPATSKMSARKVTRSGERKRQADAVLAAVRRWPDRTSAELAALMGVSRHLPARRLSELADEKNGALVERVLGDDGKPLRRICAETGEPCMVWRAKAEGEPS